MANQTFTALDTALGADWITIWQSEWAAIAVDREALEMSHRVVAAWAAEAQAAAEQVGVDADAARSARPAAPARTPAAADAPGAATGDSGGGHDAEPASDADWL